MTDPTKQQPGPATPYLQVGWGQFGTMVTAMALTITGAAARVLLHGAWQIAGLCEEVAGAAAFGAIAAYRLRWLRRHGTLLPGMGRDLGLQMAIAAGVITAVLVNEGWAYVVLGALIVAAAVFTSVGLFRDERRYRQNNADFLARMEQEAPAAAAGFREALAHALPKPPRRRWWRRGPR